MFEISGSVGGEPRWQILSLFFARPPSVPAQPAAAAGTRPGIQYLGLDDNFPDYHLETPDGDTPHSTPHAGPGAGKVAREKMSPAASRGCE